jgi:hypothetical protein
MYGCDHAYRGIRMTGTDGFVPGIPACSEARELRFLACGFVGCPPVQELLVPALGIAGAADTDRCSPYRGMSIGVPRDLLDGLRAAIFYFVCGSSTHRLIETIGCCHQRIQRIAVMESMNFYHG